MLMDHLYPQMMWLNMSEFSEAINLISHRSRTTDLQLVIAQELKIVPD